MRSLERIMVRISAVNFLPYLLLGTACIIFSSLFEPLLLVLNFKVTSSDLEHGMTVMLSLLAGILASTLVAVTIGITFHRMSNRYSLKSLTGKIFTVLVFGEVSVFLFTAYIYIKMFKDSFIGVHTATAYFPFVYGGFLCAGGIIWTIAKYLRTRPEDLRLTTANIMFKNLSFDKCCCIIENISEISLYSVSVGWICKAQLSPVQIHRCGTVQAKSELSIAYHSWYRITDQTPYIDVSDDFFPIIPDTLQVKEPLKNSTFEEA